METQGSKSNSAFKYGGLLLLTFLLAAIFITFKGAQKSSDLGSHAQVADVTPNPTSPLHLKGLDSTIRANWPAPPAGYSRQIFSTWDGNTLVSTKVLASTATVADANGLQGSHQYTIRIEGIRTDNGQKELYLTNAGSTVLQSPMTNAAFFENFMDTNPMEVKSDYLDVRTLANDGLQPESLHAERMMFMPNERHFHTEMIGGVQRAELTIHPRVPFDFTNRTGTFQTEVDMAPIQNENQGVWWEIHLTKEIPGSGRALGSGGGQEFRNGITFSIARPQNVEGHPGVLTNTNMNMALITVNRDNANPADALEFQGNVRQATGVNVRMPVVLRVSDDGAGHNTAEMFINGVSVARATGFSLGWSKGYWTIAHRRFYTSRNNDFQIPNQLVHWDTIQYDGPPGSINPTMRTYIQPNCGKVVNYDIHSYQNGGIANCQKLNFGTGQATVPFTIAAGDFAMGVRRARLVFSVTHGQAASYNVSLNGANFTVPYFDNYEYDPDPATVLLRHDLTPAELATLHAGSNTLTFTGTNDTTVTQVELETEFNSPRVIGNPPTTNPPVMIGATTNSFRIHHDPGTPDITSLSTVMFSSGAAGSVGWHADVILDPNDHDIDGNQVNDWLRISSTDGTFTDSPANIGSTGLTTLGITVDLSRLRTDCTTAACISHQPENDGKDGTVGVIRVVRNDDRMMMNHMPIYIAVMVVNDGRTAVVDQDDQLLTTFTNLNGTFNECAIPNYYCGVPTPTLPQQPTPTIDIRRTDIDRNGVVNSRDFSLLRNQLIRPGHQCTPSDQYCADVDCARDPSGNYYGITDTDRDLLQQNIGKTFSPSAPTVLCPSGTGPAGMNQQTGGSVGIPQKSSDNSTYTIEKNNNVLMYPASQ